MPLFIHVFATCACVRIIPRIGRTYLLKIDINIINNNNIMVPFRGALNRDESTDDGIQLEYLPSKYKVYGSPCTPVCQLLLQASHMRYCKPYRKLTGGSRGIGKGGGGGGSSSKSSRG